MKRLLAVLLLAVPAAAGPLDPADVPEPLKGWVKWAMRGHEEELCPLSSGTGERHCSWPGALRLELDEKGGRFTQQWRVYAETWMPLPGDVQRWPQDVTVDGLPAVVTNPANVPAVRLKPGTHAVAGSFRWDSMPEVLTVPQETGLVSVSLNGTHQAFPARDENGRLWLQKSRAADKEASHLEVSVHRHLRDDVPLTLETQVQLRVSGRAREESLGPALPKGFTPMSLVSPLPARVDPDGRLRVQARAGTWDLTLVARHDGPAAELTLGEPKGAWDSDEAWAFEAREDLRSVTVEGAPSLDPNQTEMPGGWRRFPAYLMKPGSTLRLVERRRGDSAPDPDRLTLERTFWLDFNGRGLTVQDRLSGTLTRAWRLTMGPGTNLGRVSVFGQDQFVTRLSTKGPAGVEVRAGSLNAEADSRVKLRFLSLPAVGWSHDFEHVGATLHIPPGWRLLHASGVDRATPSWVTSWTLLDLFLVVILALAVGRLWDPRWGAAALAAAALTWHEPGALRWCWLAVLAAEALVRGLPAGNLSKAARTARMAGWAAVVLWSIPFLISQVRVGLFPQLEQLGGGRSLARSMMEAAVMPMQLGEMASGAAGTVGAAADEMEADSGEVEADEPIGKSFDEFAPAAPQAAAPRYRGMGGRKAKAMRGSSLSYMSKAAQSNYPQRVKNQLVLDPRQTVTTGPGLPNWNWKTARLEWRGPVRADQRLRLWVIGPRLGFFLMVARVALTIVLALLLMGLPVEDWLKTLRAPAGWTRAAGWLFPALLVALLGTRAAAGDVIPTPEVLNELRTRLTAPPDCDPQCAESPRLRLEATPSTLRGRFEVHAAAPSAVPLPGGAKAWTPTTVLVDGTPAAGLRRAPDGSLWVPLSAGAHQIQFEGPLPDAEAVQLPLPLKPRRVEATADGWTVHGLREDGRSDDNIQLARRRGAGAPGAALQAGALPPFVLLERTLHLGLSWQVETRVVRLTPTGTPVTLEVPLLPGESVTSDAHVKAGKVQLSMGPQSAEAGWTSVLAESDAVTLTAPNSASWTEAWTLDAGPMWHVEAAGLAPLRSPDGGERQRTWRPWAGEQVTLTVTRPEGVAGKTLTIDAAELAVSPGLRATDSTLTARWRSSRGGQQTLELPEGAELQSARVDGQPLLVRPEGRNLTVPVRPGSQQVQVTWREPRGVRAFFRVAPAGLGASAVNASVSLALPPDRWVLFLGGPRLGPAVLFWSLLAVFLLVSAGLGRVGLTPLGWKQWFLLSVGLSQIPVPAAAVVALWLVLLGWRGKNPREQAREFDLLQVVLGGLTVLALSCLFASIKRGLLGLPDMQVGGNGSSAYQLRWFADRIGWTMPRPWVVSLPLGVYRLAMLAWALWLAHALLDWLKWGWQCWSAGGVWKPLRAPLPDVPPPPAR
ncbi:hypothetical protein EPO15_12935 [bacterium]|nr:MAG: hypothetical protein EPO15_12935 [bacterium]